jgi:hypothetical protein
VPSVNESVSSQFTTPDAEADDRVNVRVCSARKPIVILALLIVT